MSHISDDRYISLKLSEVLGEIGVNERMVKIKRKYSLLQESISNLKRILENDNITLFLFGSQSECTTTLELNSDADVVMCLGDALVIQNWADWKPGIINLLMVQDETTSPGYCLLQLLRDDTPQAETDVPDNDKFFKDDEGRILHKNTWTNSINAEVGAQNNGPAGTRQGLPGLVDIDLVLAFHCDSWPIEGREWLDRQCVGNWPSMDIKRSSVSKGCLLVPTGSKLNNLNDVEWRISTSMAERLMMFNLNITQIKCYVMMKIISKTFFTMNGESIITSFMCKCTLFHCIENTHAYYWREDNLFSCVMKCVCTLRDRVLNLNCPHYIIPSNNLMERRINADQQRHLLTVLHCLIDLNIDMFFAIEFDDLGTRIQMKLTNVLPLHRNVSSQIDIETTIETAAHFTLKLHMYEEINSLNRPCDQGLPERALHLVNGIQRLQSRYHTLSDVKAEACTYFAPLLASHIGSILASYSVYRSNTVSPDAIWWFSAGFESDVSSSRLKLASAFYCADDINNAESLLSELEYKYSDVVVPACSCYNFEHELPLAEWGPQLNRTNELLNKMIAYCVVFSRCETSIIPQELRQELFRSTDEEYQHRSRSDAKWMDLVVTDSLPYMYFLQYKVYTHLGHHQKQRKALSNLLKTTLKNAQNLGHRETAWNLLGQCMEQENMPLEALWCYERSLEIRPHNNAANFHKARLQRW